MSSFTDPPLSSLPLSFVVPVFNSQTTIRELVFQLTQAGDELGGEFEILLIDDRSPREMWPMLVELAEAEPRITVVRLSRNFGQHPALLCGIRLARGEFIVTLDDDLQYPPSEITRLLEALSEDVEVVYGIPVKRYHPHFRALGSYLAHCSARYLFGFSYPVSSFRLMRRSLVERIKKSTYPFVFLDGLIRKESARVRTVRVEHRPRKGEPSSYSLLSLIRLALSFAMAYAEQPGSRNDPQYEIEAVYNAKRTCRLGKEWLAEINSSDSPHARVRGTTNS